MCEQLEPFFPSFSLQLTRARIEINSLSNNNLTLFIYTHFYPPSQGYLDPFYSLYIYYVKGIIT